MRNAILAAVALTAGFSTTAIAEQHGMTVGVSWSNFQEERWKTDEAAIKAALEAAGDGPLVLGVTVLTSMDENDLVEVGVQKSPADQVLHLAQLATQAGLKGLVCSPKEFAPLREVLPPEVQLVTPGIRPAGSDSDDQKRVMTPAKAMNAGANWLVIGRPIYAAENPRQAAEDILSSLSDNH